MRQGVLITESALRNFAAASPSVGEEPSVTSLVDNVDSVRLTDAVSILSHAVGGVRDMCGEVQGQGRSNDQGSSPSPLNMQQVEALVASLNETADRLQGCFKSAQSLRLSLRSLGEEQKMTHVALRDYKDQPARTLLSSARTPLLP